MEESLRELERRGTALRLRRRKRHGQVLACLVLVLGSATIAALNMVGGMHGSLTPGTSYGSFLLSSTAGGYILAGVLAFICGVVFTLICIHARGQPRERDGTEDASLFRARVSQTEETKETIKKESDHNKEENR